jgi:hypothetical protein
MPFMLILVFLTIDVGRIVMVNTALHEAVTVAARAGARQGYVGIVRSTTCSGGVGTGNPSYDAFCELAKTIPGANVQDLRILSPDSRLNGGFVCQQNAGGSNLYVTVVAGADLDLITPFLADIVGTLNETDLKGVLTAAGTARCEVARLP